MYLRRLKEYILKDTVNKATPSTSSSTDPVSLNRYRCTTSSDNYIYGVGAVAVVAIGACVFFT